MTEQVNKERMERAAKALSTMFDYLGLKANVKATEVEGKVVLSTESEEAGRIIGKKGQSLQSLELLVNRIANKDDAECPWISINVDGYSSSFQRKSRFPRERGFGRREDRREDRRFGGRMSERREPRRERFDERNVIGEEESLQKMALDAAKEVKRWGESVQLKPMNAHERRVVHVVLSEDAEIKTESLPVEGSETLKSVIISLNQQKSQQE